VRAGGHVSVFTQHLVLHLQFQTEIQPFDFLLWARYLRGVHQEEPYLLPGYIPSCYPKEETQQQTNIKDWFLGTVDYII